MAGEVAVEELFMYFYEFYVASSNLSCKCH